METERYTFLRKELIRLYSILTGQTFVVVLPLSSFMTLKQLDRAKESPPLTGFETLEMAVERPFTVLKLLTAVDIMGDELQLGFRHPRQDIPFLYNSIQDWIRYWIEIKTNAGYLRTPDIGELELIERLAKYIFRAHAHYYHENVNKTLHVTHSSEMTLVDILRGKMMFGEGVGESLSYVSYLDDYKSSTGYSGSSYNSNYAGSDFLRGIGGM